MSDSNQTHFGFKTVNESEKASKVGEVFHSVARKYDLMNDVMSAGLHRTWKRFAVEISGVKAGDKVLDVAGGSGDLSRLFNKKVGPTGQVILTDINASMLAVGRDRLIDDGASVPALQCDAEKLPFPDNHFDSVIVAFGLRNMTHKDKALAEMRRVLKTGGRLLVLEFAKDADSYQYLAESIRMHPDQETLRQMMLDAGLGKVDYYNLAAGVVALHKGWKV